MHAQEAETSLIVLEEDDPPTVCRMLTYLYTLDYDDDGPLASAKYYMANETKADAYQALMTTTLSAEDRLMHAKMINNVVVYAIAQKYDIEELKELAMVKFCDVLWLKGPTYAFLDIITAVFETSSITDPGLRPVAVKYCTHYSTQILADKYLCCVIKDHGELGLEVLREVSKDSARNAKLRQRFYEQLVTLDEKLAQMIETASEIEYPATPLLRTLWTTHKNLEIDDEINDE